MPVLHTFVDINMNMQSPINLVLSGGGVKGVAHVAVLEHLEKLGVKINAISGSSAGALVGVLYASGKGPQEILEFFKTTPIFRYTWLNPLKAGIFDSERYETVFSEIVPESFEELKTKLIVCAVNMQQGDVVYFDQGNLIKPILASCAVPAVFTPVDIDQELYSDGGIMNNFPIEPFQNQPLPIIGSYVATPEPQTPDDLNSILKVSQHANTLLIHAANKHKLQWVDEVYEFPLGKYGVFDTKKIDDIYEESKHHIRIHEKTKTILNNI